MLEKHAFARAALPDNRRNLVLINFEVDLVKYGLVAKALGDVSEFY
jgi:hypothetical protein